MSSTVNVESAITEADFRRALDEGAQVLLKGARRRVPKLTGELARNGRAEVMSPRLAVVFFDRIYAGKQERRGWQRHDNGQAHFLRDASVQDVDAITDAIASALFGGA
jgi:hypothetical protein